MRRVAFLSAAVLGAAVSHAAEPPSASWHHVEVPPIKTSIYVASITLATPGFERQGTTLTADYSARVFPWFFWSETGHIVIQLGDADLARIARREVVEFTGSAANQKNKPRQISGRAQPLDATSGRLKIRISADGYQLVFNGTYKLGP